jgi:hypothetical protein
MYIARNSNGCLFLHEKKPRRVMIHGKGWWHSEGHKMPLTMQCSRPAWNDEPVPVRMMADWISELIDE